jgi:hypothetical protein
MLRKLGGFGIALICSIAFAQSSIQELPDLKDYQSERSSSYDRAGGNKDYRPIEPGQTIEIFNEDGPGEISHIWTTLPSWSGPNTLTDVVIRMYWDGEKDPSVEAPIGAFFGLGLGTYTTFSSALIAVLPKQALNSYFPMPFEKHGRITITNDGEKEISDYYWNIDWVKKPSIEANAAYFHAQYHQCTPCQGWYKGNFYGNDFTDAQKDPRWLNPSGDGNYVILDAKGDGQYVGVTFSVLQNQWGGWNEGDEMIWIDGEEAPRIHGTGGEDYFNAAWGLPEFYQTPLVGLTERTGWESGSRFSLYRWHLEAPIRFRKSIRVTIEDGAQNLRSDNFYSVAYWYQREPHVPFPALPKATERIPRIAWVGGPGQDPNMR